MDGREINDKHRLEKKDKMSKQKRKANQPRDKGIQHYLGESRGAIRKIMQRDT